MPTTFWATYASSSLLSSWFSGSGGAIVSPMVFCMTTAQDASPVTDITVRPMSMSRSIPAATATHSTGMLADASTSAISASEPPGIPGVPTEATVAAMAIWVVSDGFFMYSLYLMSQNYIKILRYTLKRPKFKNRHPLGAWTSPSVPAVEGSMPEGG